MLKKRGNYTSKADKLLILNILEYSIKQGLLNVPKNDLRTALSKCDNIYAYVFIDSDNNIRHIYVKGDSTRTFNNRFFKTHRKMKKYQSRVMFKMPKKIFNLFISEDATLRLMAVTLLKDIQRGR